MDFWPRVKDTAEKRDINRKTLSVQSGVPKTTIDKGIETNSEVKLSTAYKIAHSLDVSLDFLAGQASAPERREVSDINRRLELEKKYHDHILALESLDEKERAFVMERIQALMNALAQAKV